MSFSQRSTSRLPRVLGTAAVSALMATATGLTGYAAAVEVTPAENNEVCRITDGASDFWEELRSDAIDERLTELDDEDPGLGTAIRDYAATASQDAHTPGSGVEENTANGTTSPGELQSRLSDVGSSEGVGMFLTDGQGESPAPSGQEESRSDFPPDKAREAADAIGDDPAALAEESLAHQSQRSGARLHEIEEDLFHSRRDAYNNEQFDLRDQLNNCANEIDGWRIPTGPVIIGIAALVAIIAVVIIALRNRRRPDRHSHSG